MRCTAKLEQHVYGQWRMAQALTMRNRIFRAMYVEPSWAYISRDRRTILNIHVYIINKIFRVRAKTGKAGNRKHTYILFWPEDHLCRLYAREELLLQKTSCHRKIIEISREKNQTLVETLPNNQFGVGVRENTVRYLQ